MKVRNISSLALLLCFMSISLVCFSQISKQRVSYVQKKEKPNFIINPLEVKMHKIDKTKSGHYNLLKNIVSPSYDIEFTYGSAIDENFSSYLYSTSEIYTDHSDNTNNYKATYTYDTNQNLSRISLYLWKNNAWD